MTPVHHHHRRLRLGMPLLLACGLSLLGACSAPATSPQAAAAPAPAQPSVQPEPVRQLTLQGRLVLRGSAPLVQPSLQTAAGEVWQLQGLSAQQIDQWQRQNVEVQGQPLSAAPPAAGQARAPQLQVQSIRALP